jgi:hypothetical protein
MITTSAGRLNDQQAHDILADMFEGPAGADAETPGRGGSG